MNTDQQESGKQKIVAQVGTILGISLFGVMSLIKNKVFVHISDGVSFVVVIALVIAVIVRKRKKSRNLSSPGKT